MSAQNVLTPIPSEVASSRFRMRRKSGRLTGLPRKRTLRKATPEAAHTDAVFHLQRSTLSFSFSGSIPA